MRHVYNSLLKTAIYRITVALVSFAVLWSLTGDFVWGGWLALCVEAANAAWFFIFDILWERYKKHKSPKDPLTTNHTSLSREGGDHDVIGCFPSNAGWLANRSPPARGRELEEIDWQASPRLRKMLNHAMITPLSLSSRATRCPISRARASSSSGLAASLST